MHHAVLFPGQGSQAVGMGADLFEARPDLLGEAADEVLGWSLRDTCLQGPEEELTRTDRAQPALYALAYALWDTLRKAGFGQPVAAAGHSLGEYTALAAAGALPYLDGLQLVAARGTAMASAAARSPSGMAALLGADVETAQAVAAKRRDDGGRLWVANVNAPGQVVVAGGAEDLEWLSDTASDLGLRRVVALNVAGAFHSPLMEPAAAELGRALETVPFATPAFPIWANATALPHEGEVGPVLLTQLTSPVLFADSLSAMAESGVTAMVHVGPGDVTLGMAKRSAPGVETVAVSSLADVDAALSQFAGSVQ